MYNIVVMAWMYLTPIIYPETLIPESYRPWIFGLNPMYYFIKIFRMPVFDGTLPDTLTLSIAIVISISTLIIGWSFFSRKADDFAYHI